MKNSGILKELGAELTVIIVSGNHQSSRDLTSEPSVSKSFQRSTDPANYDETNASTVGSGSKMQWLSRMAENKLDYERAKAKLRDGTAQNFSIGTTNE